MMFSRTMRKYWLVAAMLSVFLSRTGAEDSGSKVAEEERDNGSTLSQLLGDYDKVKALSEGSDCRCTCVVRPLSRSACRRIEEGSASAQDHYTVETVSSGPGCKCACVAPHSAVNPCEAEFWVKKLQEAARADVKLSTLLDLLEGSFYGLDLLKLHLITSKLVGHVDPIEKVGSLKQTKDELKPTKGPQTLEEAIENPPLSASLPLQETKWNATVAPTTTATGLEEVFEQKLTEDEASFQLLNQSADVKKDPVLKQKEASQATKADSNGMIIRSMTFYKSDPEPMVADGEPGDFFDYHGFSGDSPLDDLFIEQNLLRHRASLPWVRVGQRSSRPRTSLFQNSKKTSQTSKKNSVSVKGGQISVMETTQVKESPTTRSYPVASSAADDGMVTIDKLQPADVDKWNPLKDNSVVTSTKLRRQQSEGLSTSALTQTYTAATMLQKLKDQTTHSIPATAASTITKMVPTSPTDLGLTTSPASAIYSQTPATDQWLPPATLAHTSSGRKYKVSQEEKVVNQVTEEQIKREEGRPVRRTGECKDTLATISEPVTHNTYGRTEGAWMKDPTSDSEKIYVANFYYGNNLLEFHNMDTFKAGRVKNSYKLPYSWIGTGHVVYNGAFFYNRAFSRDIIKFNLGYRRVTAWTLLHDAVIEESSSPWEWRSHSDVDFALDESGLWIIYPALDNEGFLHEVIVLSRLNPTDLSMQRETTWRTGLRRNHYGNCFVVCGVLYAVDSYERKDANLEYAFDTHTNTQMSPRMPFTNNYTFTTQVDYNPKDGLLYAWDRGHQVTYDVRFAYIETK